MFCPSCRSEYRDGIVHCATCDAALVDQLPEDLFASPEAMVQALADKALQPVMMGPLAALLDAQRLFLNQRIPTLMARAGEGGCEGNSCVATQLYLMVDENDLPRAREIMQQQWHDRVQAQGLDVCDVSTMAQSTCPACSAEVPDSVAECPQCGLFVGEVADSEAPSDTEAT